MKPGTHNLGSNGSAKITVVKVDAGQIVLRQTTARGLQEVTLSINQVALLKEIIE
jgi:hypothetical protein